MCPGVLETSSGEATPFPWSFTPQWLPWPTCGVSGPEQGCLGGAVMRGVWEVTLGEEGARTLQEMVLRPPQGSARPQEVGVLELGEGTQSRPKNHKPMICPYAPTQPPCSCPLSQPRLSRTRLQQYMNHELPGVQTGFRKGRGTRDQIANIRCIIEKASEFQKNIYFCFIDYAKAFDCVDLKKLWKILKEMGIPEHLTCLLRNLYAGQ